MLIIHLETIKAFENCFMKNKPNSHPAHSAARSQHPHSIKTLHPYYLGWVISSEFLSIKTLLFPEVPMKYTPRDTLLSTHPVKFRTRFPQVTIEGMCLMRRLHCFLHELNE